MKCTQTSPMEQHHRDIYEQHFLIYTYHREHHLKDMQILMEQHALKSVNNCMNTNILLLLRDVWWSKF
jgi:hypothetical protein